MLADLSDDLLLSKDVPISAFWAFYILYGSDAFEGVRTCALAVPIVLGTRFFKLFT